MARRTPKVHASVLEKDPSFVEWYCFKEDKWLQNANFEEKLIAIFGSVENANKSYEKYLIEEGIT
jgi:hypothetical protein